MTNNDRGIDVDSSGNPIIRNSAHGNTNFLVVAPGTKSAQIIVPSTGFVSTNPWTNFSF